MLDSQTTLFRKEKEKEIIGESEGEVTGTPIKILVDGVQFV